MQVNRFGYYWLDTWVLANVIQLATHDFGLSIMVWWDLSIQHPCPSPYYNALGRLGESQGCTLAPPTSPQARQAARVSLTAHTAPPPRRGCQSARRSASCRRG